MKHHFPLEGPSLCLCHFLYEVFPFFFLPPFHNWDLVYDYRKKRCGQENWDSGVLGREIACECLGIAPPPMLSLFWSVEITYAFYGTPLYVGSGGSNSGSHTCLASALPTEPAPQTRSEQKPAQQCLTSGEVKNWRGSSCLAKTTKKAHGMVPNISAFKTQS